MKDGFPTSRSAAPSAAGLFGGISILFEALRFLRRQRSLWLVAAAPVALAIAAVSIAATGLVSYSGEVHTLVSAWLPVLEAGAWYTWVWIGPGKALFWLIGWILFAAAAAAAVAVAFLAANVAAAPFLDQLSRRTEEIVSGSVVDSSRSLWSEAWRSIVLELQRLTFFTSLSVMLAVVSMLIPGAQLIAPVAFFVLTALFLPLEYCSYTLDRRGIAFRDRRQWIRSRLAIMFGFGAGAFATFLVPGLNFLMIPTLVVAGTLLTLREGPRSVEGERAGSDHRNVGKDGV